MGSSENNRPPVRLLPTPNSELGRDCPHERGHEHPADRSADLERRARSADHPATGRVPAESVRPGDEGEADQRQHEVNRSRRRRGARHPRGQGGDRAGGARRKKRGPPQASNKPKRVPAKSRPVKKDEGEPDRYSRERLVRSSELGVGRGISVSDFKPHLRMMGSGLRLLNSELQTRTPNRNHGRQTSRHSGAALETIVLATQRPVFRRAEAGEILTGEILSPYLTGDRDQGGCNGPDQSSPVRRPGGGPPGFRRRAQRDPLQ